MEEQKESKGIWAQLQEDPVYEIEWTLPDWEKIKDNYLWKVSPDSNDTHQKRIQAQKKIRATMKKK